MPKKITKNYLIKNEPGVSRNSVTRNTVTSQIPSDRFHGNQCKLKTLGINSIFESIHIRTEKKTTTTKVPVAAFQCRFAQSSRKMKKLKKKERKTKKKEKIGYRCASPLPVSFIRNHRHDDKKFNSIQREKKTFLFFCFFFFFFFNFLVSNGKNGSTELFDSCRHYLSGVSFDRLLFFSF